MKKIVFVMNNIGDGGAERVGVTVGKYLARQGNKVYIAKMFSTYNDYSVEGISDIITLPNAKNKYIKHLKRLIAFQRFCKKNAIETVVVMGVGDMMINLFKKLNPQIRLVLSERNDPTSQYSVDKVLGKRVNKFLSNSDRVVFQTEDARSYFSEEVQQKGVIIPNPIKSDLPDPYTGVRRKEIINFCRLNKQKNLPLLINAFERLHKDYPEYTLRIYGRGDLHDDLVKRIKENGQDEYIFIEDFSKDIHNKVRDAAMFVSSSDFEGISNSMLEAMAIGLPVVCTDCPAGGARMMIQNGVNGLLVPVRDETALYEAMKELIEHPEKCRSLSEESIHIRERLSEEKICQKWAEII